MMRISAKCINNVELMLEEPISPPQGGFSTSAIMRARLGPCCELLKSSAITKITLHAVGRLLTQVALVPVLFDGVNALKSHIMENHLFF